MSPLKLIFHQNKDKYKYQNNNNPNNQHKNNKYNIFPINFVLIFYIHLNYIQFQTNLNFVDNHYKLKIVSLLVFYLLSNN